MRMDWHDADLDELTRLCAEGKTYSDIAAKMGRSPASVQLKASRIGVWNGLPIGGRKDQRAAGKSPLSHRGIDIGNAAELLVCADLIIAGHRAFQSAQGLPFDVVADFNGKLVKIGVKSVYRPTTRPNRERGRICYQFGIIRSSKNILQRGQRYTTADFDLCALVAIDIRSVAYLAPKNGIFPTSFHIDPLSYPREQRPRNGIPRKHWLDFPLDAALNKMAAST